MSKQKSLKFNCAIHTYGASAGDVHNQLEDLSDLLSDFEYTLLDDKGTNTYKYKIELVLANNKLFRQIRDVFLLHNDSVDPNGGKSNALPSFPKLMIQWGYEDAMSKIHIAQISDFKYKFKDNKEKVVQIECVDLPSFASQFMTHDTQVIEPFPESSIVLYGDPKLSDDWEVVKDPMAGEDFRAYGESREEVISAADEFGPATYAKQVKFFETIPEPYVKTGTVLKKLNFSELFVQIFRGVAELGNDIAPVFPDFNDKDTRERLSAIHSAYMEEYRKMFTRTWMDVNKAREAVKDINDKDLQTSLMGTFQPGVDNKNWFSDDGTLVFDRDMVYGIAAYTLREMLSKYFGVRTVLNAAQSRYEKLIYYTSEIAKQDYGVHGNLKEGTAELPITKAEVLKFSEPATQDVTVTNLDDIVEEKKVHLTTSTPSTDGMLEDLRVDGEMRTDAKTNNAQKFEKIKDKIMAVSDSEQFPGNLTREYIHSLESAESMNFDISKFSNRRDIEGRRTTESEDFKIRSKHWSKFENLPVVDSLYFVAYELDGVFTSHDTPGASPTTFEVTGLDGISMVVTPETNYYDPESIEIGKISELIQKLDTVELIGQEPANPIASENTKAETQATVDLGTAGGDSHISFNSLKPYQKLLVRYSNIKIFVDSKKGSNLFNELQAIKDRHNKYFANPKDHFDFRMYNYRTTDYLSNLKFKKSTLNNIDFPEVIGTFTDNSEVKPSCWVLELDLTKSVRLHTLPDVSSFQLRSIDDQVTAQSTGGERAAERAELETHNTITFTYGKSDPLSSSSLDSVVKFFEFNGDLRVLANMLPNVQGAQDIQSLAKTATSENLRNELIPVLISITEASEDSETVISYRKYITDRYSEDTAERIFAQLNKIYELLAPIDHDSLSIRRPVELDEQWFNDMELLEDNLTAMNTSTRTSEEVQQHESFITLISLLANRMVFANLFSQVDYQEDEIATQVTDPDKEVGTEGARPKPKVRQYQVKNTNIFDEFEARSVGQNQSNAQRAVISEYVNQYNTAWEIKIKTLGIPELDGIEEIVKPRNIKLDIRDMSREVINDHASVHWLSGNYKILGLKHNLNPKGYTSEFTLLKRLI